MREGTTDPELYDFARYRDRPKIVWPGGKTVAVWVAPNLEYYEIDPPANPARKSWTKPHPDVVGYAAKRGWEFFNHGIYNTRYVDAWSTEQ